LNKAELINNIEEVIKQQQSQPDRLNGMLGLILLDCSAEDKWIEFGFEAKEWCLNPYDGVHGGIICSIMDTAMGMGAVALTQHFVSTTEIMVSYLRPMKGSKFRIRVEYTHMGKRLIRCNCKVLDSSDDSICATAMGSFVITESRAKGLRV
jgi:uncharacterized protein (TIGR00369 family)